MVSLAVQLDIQMLGSRGIGIASPFTHIQSMPPIDGEKISAQIGGRWLVHYAVDYEKTWFQSGTDFSVWVTPTPFTSTEAIAHLALSTPEKIRRFAILLDPSKLGGRYVLGPRYVALGGGIEYLLPQGFPKEALVHHSPLLLEAHGAGVGGSP